MDLSTAVESLRVKRPIFHREADFQFALAWEIKSTFPACEVRLEYSPVHDPYKYIDILVYHQGKAYPIELKYPTKKYSSVVHGEHFSLKNHGAQDLGKYDFVKDLCRIESFASSLANFKCGYVIWLTNDPSYWTPPKHEHVGYAAFSVHHGSKLSGNRAWGEQMGAGTIKGRESVLSIQSEHQIEWQDYSDLGDRSGKFRYVLLTIE